MRDFNGDGIPDLVVANATSNSFTFWAGNGDGTFRDTATYHDVITPYSVVAEDFDGDGAVDVAITLASTWDRILVFPGNGDGTFGEPIWYPTGVSPHFIAAGDFNGDGQIDLAVVNNDSDSVSIFINNTR